MYSGVFTVSFGHISHLAQHEKNLIRALHLKKKEK